MANNREALALELKQIIQADRMAGDIISDAQDMKKNIEKATEKQKEEILADARRLKEETEKQVQAKQQQALQAQTDALRAETAARLEKLEATVAQNSDAWVKEIVGRITKA